MRIDSIECARDLVMPKKQTAMRGSGPRKGATLSACPIARFGDSRMNRSVPHGLPITVSVILPTFNRAHKLGPVVAGVAAQSYTQLELIIVDDGSTDDTRGAVEELARQHPDLDLRYVRQPANLGGGAARNRGVREAKGALIAFLDSDDLWLADKLQLQVAAWHAAARPSLTTVYCQLVTHDGWRSEVRPRTPKLPETPVGDYLFIEGGYIQTSCLLLPTALAVEVPFDEALRAHQDLQLVLSLEEHGAEFVCVERVLVRYSTAPDPARVSSNRDPGPSQAFLDRYGHLLSGRARLGFEGRLMAMRYGKAGRPLKGSGMLWRALRARAVAPREFAWLLARTVIPEPVDMLVRRALRRLRGQAKGPSSVLGE